MRRFPRFVGATAFTVALAGPALGQGGTVWAWGNNSNGQLGDGTTTAHWVPAPVPGLADALSIGGGRMFSVALRSDGTVWSWGRNGEGQLGDGTTSDRHAPGPVPGLSAIVAIAGEYDHCLALRSDGTVWTWGRNYDGQLGDGTYVDRPIASQVIGLSTVVAIGAGEAHSLAVTSDGRVFAWGRNDRGQLGDGTTEGRTAPVQVIGMTEVVAVAGGGHHSYALRQDGTVWAWGWNQYCQLGDGSVTDRYTPVRASVALATAIASGAQHGAALTGDGVLMTWGRNNCGQLGDGTNVSRPTAVRVLGMDDVSAFGCGESHTLAVRRAGSELWAWGSNDWGHLGDGSSGPNRWEPVAITSLANVLRVIGCPGHQSLAITTRTPSRSFAIDRSAHITDTVSLRGYLQRAADGLRIPSRQLEFAIDGTPVGSATTDVNGRATVAWSVTEGPASRSIGVNFAGDPFFQESYATAKLVALTATTRMWGANRAGSITESVALKAYLWRRDGVAVPDKAITFDIDGTSVGVALTATGGRAQLGVTIADGTGSGTRAISARWAGDGGYSGSSCANTLYVQGAIPYLWILPKTAAKGAKVGLYAYFRRLYDYRKQSGKPVTFLVDGTPVGVSTTDANGVARYAYQTVEAVGQHVVRCEFAGDAWVEAGYGEGALSIN